MRLTLGIASLWPGFARAWLRGRWEGLVLAMLFAAALNGALVATFIGIGPNVRAVSVTAIVAWVLVLSFWTLGFVWQRRDRASSAGESNGQTARQQDVLFREAQHEYLKEHWLEAEALATRLIALSADDAEARLLLAAIQRRTKRWNEAEQTLEVLRDEPAAAMWRFEIEAELKQIEEDRSSVEDETMISERGTGNGERGAMAA